MLKVFNPLQSLTKRQTVCIDNLVFKLHYKVTGLILLTCSLLVTSRQYFGDPIDCHVNIDIPEDAMNLFCWINSTYTLLDKLDGKVGVDVAYPGVSPLTTNSKVKYHRYYQWVCFALFFQALLFYTPRYLWRTWEGGRMRMMTMNLDLSTHFNLNISNGSINQSKNLVLDYFYTNMKHHNFYARRFVLCEFLNLINVVGQIFFMDYFLDYEFSTYGIDVLFMTEGDPMKRVDPMAKVFPKMTKCTFNRYGFGGNIVPYDGLCVLPLNVINEKIYVFLWFWFIIVACISGVHFVFRLATMFVRQVRLKFNHFNARLADHIEVVSGMCDFGDWFVLYQLGENMEPLNYKGLIDALALRLEVLTSHFL